MTPTVCLCITSLVSILGFVLMLMSRSAGAGKSYGELTSSVKELTASVVEFKDLFKSHASKLDEHEADIQKLKFILDVDGNSRTIVTDVMTIRERMAKKRNSGT